MSKQALHALLSRGFVSHETVVTAKIGRRNRHGVVEYSVDDYTILEQRIEADHYGLTLKSVIGNSHIAANDRAILAIDGMSIERYADVYNINADGSDKRIGKKRGRKPKSAMP